MPHVTHGAAGCIGAATQAQGPHRSWQDGKPGGHKGGLALAGEVGACPRSPGFCSSTSSPAPLNRRREGSGGRNLLQGQDHDQPVPWKVQFNWGNVNQSSNQCRTPIKEVPHHGRTWLHLRRKICWWMSAMTALSAQSRTAVATACPAAGEPSKQLLLERFLSSNISERLMAVEEDHFELCLAKCKDLTLASSGVGLEHPVLTSNIVQGLRCSSLLILSQPSSSWSLCAQLSS